MKKIIFSWLLFFSAQAAAGEAIYTSFFSNKAVGGYDTVTYFTQGKPLKGNKKFQYKYKQANWLFVSEENLQKFKQNPEKYAPQYGGHCAWAVSEQNEKISADPLRWNIINGKLYLNYDAEIKSKWEKNIAGFITKADKNWPVLINK
jgi:YHS domain-containing protein